MIAADKLVGAAVNIDRIARLDRGAPTEIAAQVSAQSPAEVEAERQAIAEERAELDAEVAALFASNPDVRAAAERALRGGA